MQQAVTTTVPQNKPVKRSTPNATQTVMRGKRDEIEAVRSNNPIEQVIGRYVELRPSRRRLMGRCPFHDDPTPSFVVYVHNQSFYCFGCDIGGDVFRFVQRIDHLSFAEAFQFLSDSGRIGSNTLPTRRVTSTIDAKDKSRLIRSS